MFQNVAWKDIEVGNILKILNNEMIPADFVLISCQDIKGVCYVETKNLDGETNLKIRTVNKHLNQTYRTDKEINTLKGSVVCEKPNNAIYKFEGYVDIASSEEKIPQSIENFMLRGCIIRNSEYVIGSVVFTGMETKIMQNTAEPRYKFSNLELLNNKAIIIVFILQFVLALSGAIVSMIWIISNRSHHWMGKECNTIG